jgi:L-glutamine:scyllo-inosose aminotransferase/L-glutamine:2-deoxy-scyllo-inosose/3-amino-2,3-dideoxy-scyllo-inosose aminotransferase
MMERLAVAGGEPVWTGGWPAWPRADQRTEELVKEALHSNRWAISGVHAGVAPFERRFADAYARYHDVPYCVPTSSGSASLSIALEALGVARGDEVLVPGVTWVACASSVAALGAVPILVDVDPSDLCMSVDAARAAMTPRTRAIMLVHLFCACCDLDAFLRLSAETGVPLLEDCAQAHGASWNGRKVGTHGAVGTFSMQHSKVLTAGEGGAVITSDPELYDLLQQLRADGRRYVEGAPKPGLMELEEVGGIQGRNRCLSEIQAAILLDRLNHLDAENRLRERNGERLGERLEAAGLATLLARRPQVDARTFYHFCCRLHRDAFSGHGADAVSRALTAELGLLVEPIDDPLNRNVLYNPLRSPRTGDDPAWRRRLDPTRFALPNAEAARGECITLPHCVLLGDESTVETLAAAFEKVARRSGDLGEPAAVAREA